MPYLSLWSNLVSPVPLLPGRHSGTSPIRNILHPSQPMRAGFHNLPSGPKACCVWTTPARPVRIYTVCVREWYHQNLPPYAPCPCPGMTPISGFPFPLFPRPRILFSLNAFRVWRPAIEKTRWEVPQALVGRYVPKAQLSLAQHPNPPMWPCCTKYSPHSYRVSSRSNLPVIHGFHPPNHRLCEIAQVPNSRIRVRPASPPDRHHHHHAAQPDEDKEG
jgi:hypothetical protein